MNLDHQQAHPVDAKREEQKSQALSLRIARGSYRSIARTLGVSVSTAHELVTEALSEVRQVNEGLAAELKELEGGLLDQLTVKLWPKGDKALDPKTAMAILRIRESFRRLHGLDAPVRGEFSGPGGGPIPVAAGVLDLSKLSVDELRQLEQIYSRAGAAAQLTSGSTAVSQAGGHPNGEPHA